MVKYVSKSEFKPGKTKESYNPGEIFPNIFFHLYDTENLNFLETAIIWLGSYKLKNENFPKENCPKCSAQSSMIPYACGGSILSGCHTIQFYCPNCKEQFVTNNHIEYFRLIYKYILENRDNLPKSSVYSTDFSID